MPAVFPTTYATAFASTASARPDWYSSSVRPSGRVRPPAVQDPSPAEVAAADVGRIEQAAFGIELRQEGVLARSARVVGRMVREPLLVRGAHDREVARCRGARDVGHARPIFGAERAEGDAAAVVVASPQRSVGVVGRGAGLAADVRHVQELARGVVLRDERVARVDAGASIRVRAGAHDVGVAVRVRRDVPRLVVELGPAERRVVERHRVDHQLTGPVVRSHAKADEPVRAQRERPAHARPGPVGGALVEDRRRLHQPARRAIRDDEVARRVLGERTRSVEGEPDAFRVRARRDDEVVAEAAEPVALIDEVDARIDVGVRDASEQRDARDPGRPAGADQVVGDAGQAFAFDRFRVSTDHAHAHVRRAVVFRLERQPRFAIERRDQPAAVNDEGGARLELAPIGFEGQEPRGSSGRGRAGLCRCRSRCGVSEE